MKVSMLSRSDERTHKYSTYGESEMKLRHGAACADELCHQGTAVCFSVLATLSLVMHDPPILAPS